MLIRSGMLVMEGDILIENGELLTPKISHRQLAAPNFQLPTQVSDALRAWSARSGVDELEQIRDRDLLRRVRLQ